MRSSTSKPPRLPPQAKPAHLAAAQHQSLPASAAISRQNLRSSTSRFRGLRRKQNTHARTQSSLRGSTTKAHEPPRQTKFNGNDTVCSSTSKPPWPPARAPVFVFHSSTSAPSGPLPQVKSRCPQRLPWLSIAAFQASAMPTQQKRPPRNSTKHPGPLQHHGLTAPLSATSGEIVKQRSALSRASSHGYNLGKLAIRDNENHSQHSHFWL